MYPIARLGGRLTLSFARGASHLRFRSAHLAGVQPAPRFFAPAGLANAHSGASNCGFQDEGHGRCNGQVRSRASSADDP